MIKQKLAAETREKVKGKKVVALYTSIFLQIAFAGVSLLLTSEYRCSN